jgi:hypothetical protein
VPNVNARTQRRAVVVGACSLAALLAPPAAQAQTADVRPGRNVTVFANIGLVGATGYTVDSRMRIDVVRDGHAVASASGSALSGDEGIGLMVNHGPSTAVALPGDCWTNSTPRIRPGDVIRVSADGGVDTVGVDDIRITVAPHLVGDDVVVEGVARYADGTPISVAALDSGEVRNGAAPRIRATPTRIDRVDGTDDGWRMVFERSPAAGPAYGVFRNDDGAELDEQRDQILGGDHAIGYGHVDPLPAVTQLAEGMQTSAPAPGCEGSPLAPENALTTLDDDVVNIASGDLTAGGVSAPGTDVTVTVDDANPATAPVALDATEAPSGAWSAPVPRARLEGLDDATLRITASFAGLAGNTLTIAKDTVAPAAITATPPAGTYRTAQVVTLSTGDGTDVIRFTRNGLQPGPRSQRATGSISVPTSQTLLAYATDTAGNVTPVQTLKYTIEPASAGGGGGPAGGGPALVRPIATPPALGSASTQARKPYLRSFATTPRIRRSAARRAGIRVTLRAGSDAKVVRIRVFRRRAGGKRQLIATSYRTPRGTGLNRVRLAERALRRKLQVGTYELDATPGTSRTDLGTTSRYGLRVVKG